MNACARKAQISRRSVLMGMVEAAPRSLVVNSERTDIVHSMLASAVEIALSMVLATSERASLFSL